ncbi:phosphatase PAP2 family protein [Chloroflexota bacterium]
MSDFLWSIIPWGYLVLLNIEAMHNDILDGFFPIITMFGDEMGIIVIMSLVYWCVNKRVGQTITFAYLYTAALGTWIKELFGIPRPDDPAFENILNKSGISKRISPLIYEHPPSFLSLHTQGAVVVWGYMAYAFKKTWFTILAVILITLIAFSRMYVGVHFPQDVIGGLIVGIVYLVVLIWAEPYVRDWLSKQSNVRRYALAILIPLVVWILNPVEANATSMGAAIGMGVGFVLEGQTLGYSASGKMWRRVLRGAIGLVLIFAVFFGLDILFSFFDESMGETMALVWRLIRYALLGFAGGFVVPWFFVKTRLAPLKP